MRISDNPNRELVRVKRFHAIFAHHFISFLAIRQVFSSQVLPHEMRLMPSKRLSSMT